MTEAPLWPRGPRWWHRLVLHHRQHTSRTPDGRRVTYCTVIGCWRWWEHR